MELRWLCLLCVIVGISWFITDSVYFHYGIAVATFCCDIIGFIIDFVFLAAIDFYDTIYMEDVVGSLGLLDLEVWAAWHLSPICTYFKFDANWNFHFSLPMQSTESVPWRSAGQVGKCPLVLFLFSCMCNSIWLCCFMSIVRYIIAWFNYLFCGSQDLLAFALKNHSLLWQSRWHWFVLLVWSNQLVITTMAVPTSLPSSPSALGSFLRFAHGSRADQVDLTCLFTGHVMQPATGKLLTLKDWLLMAGALERRHHAVFIMVKRTWVWWFTGTISRSLGTTML